MADPSTSRIRAALGARLRALGVIGVLWVVGAMAAGCSAAPQMGEDDPSAPILFTAEVFEVGPKPVPGARYRVLVYRGDHDLIDQSEPLIDALYTAVSDGTFDVHLEPTPDLRAWSRYNGSPVEFSVFVVDSDGDRVFHFGFMRDLGSDAWAGDPLTIQINPDQPEYWVPMDRVVPASRPPAT